MLKESKRVGGMGRQEDAEALKGRIRGSKTTEERKKSKWGKAERLYHRRRAGNSEGGSRDMRKAMN